MVNFKAQILYCSQPPSLHCQDYSPIKTLYPVSVPALTGAEETQRWVGRENKANKIPTGDSWDVNVSTRLLLMEMELAIKEIWENPEFEAILDCIGEHMLAAADASAFPSSTSS